MLNREFTKREKILILILVFLLLFSGYFKFVLQPAQERVTAAQNACADIENSMTVETVKAKRLADMRAAIDSYENKTDGKSSVVPLYDNIDNVMVQLDAIMKQAADYSLTFDDIQQGDQYVARPVEMSFTCGSYDAAKKIISDLDGCVYKCSLDNITVSTGKDSGGVDITKGGVAVKLTATFYEAYK
jgi:Tfp pilus assembly protein PilO